ncbi:Deferrochelatase/peroxidase EfeB precursor [Acinetobacter baumannii]|nr:Deferrochelatase/peroxidase EfeB precursor [Acinetobacter baumannii]
MGFKDGTANPKTDDKPLMDKVVWVGDSVGEPAWTAGGSYQAARIIRFRVEFWDRTPLQEQETIFGREKHSGAPLGMKHEHDEPNYANDPDGKVIPMDAHIRLANPRTPESQSNLMLRRGYSYSLGVSNAGQLEMGLLFVCYQADLEKGFLTVQKRLNGEALEEYIKPIGGGYFFVLPGVKERGDYLASGLLKA